MLLKLLMQTLPDTDKEKMICFFLVLESSFVAYWMHLSYSFLSGIDWLQKIFGLNFVGLYKIFIHALKSESFASIEKHTNKK